MKRMILSIFILAALCLALQSCVSASKYQRSLRGLMLQDNTYISRNKAYHSRHNMKARREADRKYRRNM